MFGEPRNDIEKQICDIEKDIYEKEQKIRELRGELPAEKINDYTFKNLNGDDVKLSQLFADKSELILIHNMGSNCAYCTLWADGFQSAMPYINSRCAFALENELEPKALATFVEKRGWKFPVYSSAGSNMKSELGFKNESGVMPGVSTFYKDESGQIFRHATAPFGPGDRYAPVWHFFDLLKNGRDGWQPNFHQ